MEVFESVKQWIEKNDGFVHKQLQSSLDQSTGIRGLFAKEHIDVDSPIIRIPSVCILNGSSLSAISSLTLKHPIPDICLVLSLLEEKKKGTQSFFAPYMDTLPTVEDFSQILPSWWSEDERLKCLKGSNILKQIDQENSDLFHDFKILSEKEGLIIDLNLKSLKWALGVVNSRAFVKRTSGTRAGSEEMSCLVPAMDLMNHARPCLAGFKFIDSLPPINSTQSSEDMYVEIRREVVKDNEVTITYGAKSCMNLLLHYGFTLKSNTDPDGSSNDLRALSFSLLNNREGTSSMGEQTNEKRIKLNENEAILFQNQKDRWYSGNDDETRIVQLRLASSSAPKHYTYTPFTKALDGCRVLTLNMSDIEDTRQGRGGGGGGRQQSFQRELRAVKHLVEILNKEISEYHGTTSLSISQDCLRLIRREVQTLSFYKEAAETVGNILNILQSKGGVSKAKELLAAVGNSDIGHTEQDKEENPLLYPLTPVSSVACAYFQIKFGISLS